MNTPQALRVGVLFGGRSGEHEVSLASARNVLHALQQAGHRVIPMGITREGRWLTAGDPMAQLTSASAGELTERNGASEPSISGTGSTPPKGTPSPTGTAAQEEGWALLPRSDSDEPLATVDVIFPVLHGPYGEDGTVQGLLQMANLPYVGCGVLASAVAMDKDVAKRLFAAEGLQQTRYRVIRRGAWKEEPESVLDELWAALDAPLFVKPANMGSSVGVSKATNRDELAAAMETACRYDRKIVVEEAVPHAREIEVSVLGNSGSRVHAPMASVPGEIVPGNEFYDYEAKYEDDTSQLLIPANLTPKQTAEVREMALCAFRAIDGAGLARVDFLLDGESGELYLNEVNTMPGFTQVSMYPKLWEASGLSYPELVDRLIHLALDLHADQQQNSTFRK